MRSGKWIMSTCGILGLIVSVGLAQESALSRRTAVPSTSESSRSASTAPSRYYSRGDVVSDESEQQPLQETTKPVKKPVPRFPSTQRRNSRYTRSRPFPVGERASTPGDTSTNRTKQSYLNRLFNGEKPQAGQSSPAESTSDILNLDAKVKDKAANPAVDRVPGPTRGANYERAASSSTTGVIQQTAATVENTSPFAEPESAPPVAKRRGIRQLPLPSTDAPAKPAVARKTTVTSSAANVQTPAVEALATSGPQTPQMTIQWVRQGTINVGQECVCQLNVTNSGNVSAKNVTIDAFLPNTVRLISTDPKPLSATDHLTWKVAELKPRQKQVFNIRMIPSKRGTIETNAFVSFTAATSNVFRVQEPLLAIQVEGPKEILVGEPASQVIRVSNPGTGVATNVKLEAVVPAGLEHLRGERLSMEIGSLNPGETRVVRLALAAVGGGEQVLNMQVVADGNLRKSGSKSINVVAPNVVAKLTGPKERLVGRAATYTLSVTNESDFASNNVRAVYQIPAGFQFVRVDKGGRLNAKTGSVNWFIGRLDAGQSVKRSIYLTAVETGDFVHNAAVSSEHGASASAQLGTTVDATAALTLDFVEQADPVKVGTDTAFEIRVRNDGGKAASNVGVSIELPSGVKYLSARGPSDFLAENGLLVFKSVGRLDPGKTAVYRVYVSGTSAGNHRIRARVASDSIREPLIGEELTKFQVD